MAEEPKENAESGSANDTGTENGTTSAIKPEDLAKLEADKTRLQQEIEAGAKELEGIKGTKGSLLEDIERIREEKRKAKEESTTIDLEAVKKEVTTSVLTEVEPLISKLKDDLVKTKESELAAKKALAESINARMASASGSSGQSSPDSISDNEVELSKDEKAIAQELGIQNPRYLKDVEVR